MNPEPIFDLGDVKIPSERAFDWALLSAQVVPDEAKPFFLALIAPAIDRIDRKVTASLVDIWLPEGLPDEALTFGQWFEAVSAGDRIRAAALERWLRDDAQIPESAWDAVDLARDFIGMAETFLSHPSARTADQPGKDFPVWTVIPSSSSN